MPIDWGTVVTAAVTAALVTLLMAHVCTPGAEARRERRLETLRTRRELRTTIATLTMAARMSVTELPPGADAPLRQRWADEQRRHHARLQTLVTDLFDDLGRYVAAYPEPVSVDLIRSVVCLHGVMLSSRSDRGRAEIVHAVGRALTKVVNGTPGGSGARDELRSIIARTAAPDVTAD